MKTPRFVQLAMLAMLVFGGAETAVADPIYSYTTINVPGVNGIDPHGINSSGQIVGSFVPPGCSPMTPCRSGFLYADGVFTVIDDPHASHLTYATGINDSGQIVGNLGFIASFLYTGGSFTDFSKLGARQTIAIGINDSGQIVGEFDDGLGPVGPDHGFLYSGGSFTTIDDPVGVATNAAAINNRGQIVGDFFDATHNTHGFLDAGGIFTTIDFPGAARSLPTGINDQGEIVGWSSDAFGVNRHSFLDSGGVFTPIDFPGATLTMAFGINDSGQIVGDYYDASGQHGFLATPVATPEPSSLVALATCLVALFGIAWHRRRASDGRRPLA